MLDNGLNTMYERNIFLVEKCKELQYLGIFEKYNVILDEATSFSDPENEHILQQSFKKTSDNKPH